MSDHKPGFLTSENFWTALGAIFIAFTAGMDSPYAPPGAAIGMAYLIGKYSESRGRKKASTQ